MRLEKLQDNTRVAAKGDPTARCRGRVFWTGSSANLDGVTGRQSTVVAAVAVPQSDEVENGVRLGLLQASSRDDHGALCRYRRVIGKREPVRCRRDGRIIREAKVASEPEVLIGWFRSLGLEVTRIGLEAGPLSNGCMQACGSGR